MKHRHLETLLLLQCLLAPFLPSPYSALALLVLLGLWLLLRPPGRELYLTGAALLLAALALLGGWLVERRPPPPRERWIAAAEARYEALWQDLEARTQVVAAEFSRIPEESSLQSIGRSAFVRAAFDRLAAALEPVGAEPFDLFLLDESGEAVAWAGEGLLHRLEGGAVPVPGRTFRASFSAVTLLAAVALPDADQGTSGWGIVAGRSLPTDRLPFEPPWPYRAGDFRWSVAADASQAGPGVWRQLTLPATPALMAQLRRPAVRDEPFGWLRAGARQREAEEGEVADTGAVDAGTLRPAQLALLAALWLIGLALVGLAVLRGVGLAIRGGQEPSRWTPLWLPPPVTGPDGSETAEPRLQVALLAIAGCAAWALAATGSLLAALMLVVGGTLAAIGLLARDSPRREPHPVTFKGLAVAVLLGGTAWALQALWGGPVDLGADIFARPEVFCLRLAFWAFAFGLFLLAGRQDGGVPLAGDAWAWGAAVLLVAAAASHDNLEIALPLLAGGAIATAVWAEPREIFHRPGRMAALVLLAALAGASAWELAYRTQLRSALGAQALAGTALPPEAQRREVGRELQSYFSLQDLAELLPRDPSPLELEDLAFVLWQRSPLARPNALSALVVRPEIGKRSAFAYGLTFDDRQESVLLPDNVPALPLWDLLETRGRGVLLYRGQRWGEVEFWLRPRPGFALTGTRDAARDDPDRPSLARLLGGGFGGGFGGGDTIRGLPGGAHFALYDPQGQALLTPWRQAPPLPAEVQTAGEDERSVVATPAGAAWAWSRRGPDGWGVVYLPVLPPLGALDRVATHAVSVLLLLTAVTGLGLLLALPRPAFRDLLRRVVRSYSKRLLIVYTVLLLVPLPLIGAALIRVLEQRLWQTKLAEGEAAVLAAGRYLSEELPNLEPGFTFDSAPFANQLRRLASLVHHDVNLYWRNRQAASSRRELFAAGLLPERIPGEVYARVVLGGFGLSSRTRLLGDRRYVELYAPLVLPGMGPEPSQLLVSVPLLAQQQEVSRELAHLRRQTFLLTAALFALLVAVSVRLAGGFTRPITALVEGTRRIAAGAPSFDVRPAELELTALAEAVDDMARRVAESRSRLMREKQVVESMVQHITAGVVSLDREGRVLLRNQVAAELIGAAVGEPLLEALARDERLAPVAELVAAAGGELSQTTLRLPGEDGAEREWSLVWVPVPGSGEPAALLVVEDVTEVLRGQRLAAWAEMARIIAHEIKNPLTPIRLSAEHMQQVHRRDPAQFDTVFERCTTNILRQVEELRSIASEFSTYSSILRIEPKAGDLAEAIGEVVEGYRAAPPPGVEVTFEADPPHLPARFDARLLGRAVRNLIENAVRASGGQGRVAVRVEGLDGRGVVTVADEGPGVKPELLGRIFDPYFSTHDTGTGLGLPISRRIAEEHGGSITARNRPSGGLEVVITLPVQQARGSVDDI